MDSSGRDPGAATFRWQGKTQPAEYSLADIGVSLAMDPDRIRPHGWCAMAMPASCSESAGGGDEREQKRPAFAMGDRATCSEVLFLEVIAC
jgi:hypothetical protein